MDVKIDIAFSAPLGFFFYFYYSLVFALSRSLISFRFVSYIRSIQCWCLFRAWVTITGISQCYCKWTVNWWNVVYCLCIDTARDRERKRQREKVLMTSDVYCVIRVMCIDIWSFAYRQFTNATRKIWSSTWTVQVTLIHVNRWTIENKV